MGGLPPGFKSCRPSFLQSVYPVLLIDYLILRCKFNAANQKKYSAENLLEI